MLMAIPCPHVMPHIYGSKTGGPAYFASKLCFKIVHIHCPLIHRKYHRNLMFIVRKRLRRIAVLASTNESTQSHVIWATYSHAWPQIVVDLLQLMSVCGKERHHTS